jgi:two-component system, chemotaxis family, chemotaxis protein CheY
MKTILVVDDSATMRRMVIASLRAVSDIQCSEAGSGLEAIERLALAPVDLIVLDLNMPDIHGIEVLQFVRSHERYRAIPVIVLTTRGDDDSRAVAFTAGASQYLTKPLTPQLLATQVSTLLDR